MRVGPTLATGRQGCDRLMGRMVACLLSHKPGKQEEKAAKPPNGRAEKEKERERGLVITQKINTDMTNSPLAFSKNSHLRLFLQVKLRSAMGELL